jgi:hypothetical protein
MEERKLKITPKEDMTPKQEKPVQAQENGEVNNLRNICYQLSEQNKKLVTDNKQLIQRLQATTYDYMFTTLKMLVDIVNGNNSNFSPEFIKYVCEQIEEKVYELTRKEDDTSTEPSTDSNQSN